MSDGASDRPKFSNEREKQLVLYTLIGDLCAAVNNAAKPLDKRGITSLVEGRPIGPDELKKMVRPEEMERAAAAGVSLEGEGTLLRKHRRQPAIAALISKAAATLHAVAILVENGHGASAYTLTRILLENCFVIGWLLLPHDEEHRNERIDTYILHYEAFIVRYDEVLQKREVRAPEYSRDWRPTERTRALSAEVFDDRWVHWAFMKDAKTGKKRHVRLNQMAGELGLRDLYELDYFRMSEFVHSAAASIQGRSGPAEIINAGDTFLIQPELFGSPMADSYGDRALSLGNMSMLGVLELIDIRYGFGIGASIERIRQMFYRSANEPQASRKEDSNG